MHRFWKNIIKPIFIEENVKSIVEIGCDFGHNTFNILDYCSVYEGRFTAIDPEPSFDYHKLEEENVFFTFIKDFSLNVLSKVKEYDAVLIDGDHNWYTVFNELKIIEKSALNNKKFPLVFLHDIEWPYARRDMYYFPETIPTEFRQPYAKKGILPYHSKVIDSKTKSGMNPHLNNAIFEGGEKNGVLTAIEDFINESPFSLSLYKLPQHHGLGILIQYNNNLQTFIKNLVIK
jgi:Methyltransferase domain